MNKLVVTRENYRQEPTVYNIPIHSEKIAVLIEDGKLMVFKDEGELVIGFNYKEWDEYSIVKVYAD